MRETGLGVRDPAQEHAVGDTVGRGCITNDLAARSSLVCRELGPHEAESPLSWVGGSAVKCRDAQGKEQQE